MRYCGKILQSGAGHRWQYDTGPLHARYLRLQTHMQNMWNSLLFHCNNGCTNVPQCYIIHKLPVLLYVHRIFNKHSPQALNSFVKQAFHFSARGSTCTLTRKDGATLTYSDAVHGISLCAMVRHWKLCNARNSVL